MGHIPSDLIVRISLAALWLLSEGPRPGRNPRPSSLVKTRKYQKPAFLEIIEQPPETGEENHMIDFQIETEKLFHKNQLFPRIKNEFTTAQFNFRKHMLENQIDPDFGFDLLVQMVLRKRAKLEVLVGLLRRHFKGDCQATVNALEQACRADLVDWNPTTRQFIIRYDITQDVQDDLDRYQYPMPMVVEPRELRTNEDTGYYTTKNSVILRNNHHDLDVCLDHLNRMNRIKFQINSQVAHTIKNQWRNLDKPKPDEERTDYFKRVKAFEKYDRTVHDVLMYLGLANGGEFYLTHKYDKRGRTYCQGYQVNYQGASWNKAVVQFADEEVTNG